MCIFMSLNARVSISFSCDFVMCSKMFSPFENLLCSESKTWLNDSRPSHVTLIVLFNILCGAHEHGDISGLIEQCRDATCTIETTVYTSDAIFSPCFSKSSTRNAFYVRASIFSLAISAPRKSSFTTSLQQQPLCSMRTTFRIFVFAWIDFRVELTVDSAHTLKISRIHSISNRDTKERGQ